MPQGAFFNSSIQVSRIQQVILERIRSKVRLKLDQRAKKVLFMGITFGVKRSCLLCPKSKKIIFNKDVTFDKSSMLLQEKKKDFQKKN